MDSVNTTSNNNSDTPIPKLPYSLKATRIPPSLIYSSFVRFKQQYPFLPEYVGKTNPYTGCLIRTEADYDEYLREHACYEHCSNAVETAEQGRNFILQAFLKHAKDPPPDRCKNLCEQCESRYKGAVDKLKKTEQELERRRRRTRISCCIVVLFSILLCVLFSSRSYRNGYTVGEEAGYSAGKEDGYKDGQRDGYRSGYADNFRNRSSSPATSTGTGTPRDTAISDGYIGNKKTKKYHLSTCSYLPDKWNQVSFDSSTEAESQGYKPCSHCNP